MSASPEEISVRFIFRSLPGAILIEHDGELAASIPALSDLDMAWDSILAGIEGTLSGMGYALDNGGYCDMSLAVAKFRRVPA
jgi:hypothetical protein